MLSEVGSLLRTEGRFAIGAHRVPWGRLVAITFLAAFLYGVVMGFYAGRPLQAFYSGLKVPVLLAVATVVCLPSFYVINTLLGLRDDLPAALRGILSAQATLALVLAALAPITEVLYLSTDDYVLATLFNGVVFAVATLGAQSVLSKHYQPLVAVQPLHRIAKAAWIVVYIFVAVQSAWVLRPFVGAPNMAPEFFREDAWSNAYVEIFERILRTFGL